MTGKPVRRVRKEQDQAWAGHSKGVELFSTADDIDAAWGSSTANQPFVSVDHESIPAEFFMETHELETIVATELRGTVPYEAAQKALLARPEEYKPGTSGGKRYQGADPLRLDVGK